MHNSITVELLEQFTQYLRVLDYQDVFVEQLRQLRELPSEDRPRSRARAILDNMENNQRCLARNLSAIMTLYDHHDSTINDYTKRLEEIYPPDAYTPDPTVLSNLFE